MGTLYVVGVPIGNLEDITLRALRVLRTVPRIACEDTRRTGKLLELLEIPRPALVSVHEHNEAARVPGLLKLLADGEDLALVSDAGTPAVSDPGYRLVRAALDAGVTVVPIPGPSAAITALCAAGLPTDRFRFIGFLPSKGAARRRGMSELADASETLVFYVSPHRLESFLADAAAIFGETRPAVIAREMTKRYEAFRRGTLAELVETPGPARGELVVLVGGAPEEVAPDGEALRDVVAHLMAGGYTTSRAAKEAARRTGARRSEAYQAALSIQAEGETS